MYIVIILLSGLFLGMMIPTVMVSAFRKTTIKLLEAWGFFKKGTLFAENRMGITGAGYQRDSMTYLTKLPGRKEDWVTGRVFGYMLLVFEGAFLVLGLLTIAIMKLFF
jgi:hypothetical protein